MFTLSLIGEAKLFLIRGFGVICIDKKCFVEDFFDALGLVCELKLFCLIMLGTEALLMVSGTIWGQVKLSREIPFSSVKPDDGLLMFLQTVVLTMKLPETDFVFVIDLAALKKTLDFELERSAMDEGAWPLARAA